LVLIHKIINHSLSNTVQKAILCHKIVHPNCLRL